MKRVLLILATMLTLNLGLAATVPVLAAAPPDPTASAKSEACAGIGLTGGDCTNGSGESSVNKLIRAIVEILSIVVGVAAVIGIIISGFKYITAAGDSNKIASAKSTLIYALVGLVIVASAQFLVHFALHTASTATNGP